jgi:predicted ribosomally synthesized peptide with SipW-like signal peptide
MGIVALIAALLLIGVGVFAAFTDTETTSVATETGALDITGSADITISDLAPGDYAFRSLSVAVPTAENDGNLIRAIRVSVPTPEEGADVPGAPTDTGDEGVLPAGASLLTGAQGLRATLARCSGAWTLPAAGAALGTDANSDGIDDSAICAGSITVTQPEVALNDLVGATSFEFDAADFGVTPTSTGTIPDGTTINFIAQFRLPGAADDAYENASLTIDLLFEAVQRTGLNR